MRNLSSLNIQRMRIVYTQFAKGNTCITISEHMGTEANGSELNRICFGYVYMYLNPLQNGLKIRILSSLNS